MCVFIKMVKWHSMCGQSGLLCHPVQPHTHTHIHSTHLHSTSVYPSLSAHTNTRVRPPRLEGNHEKATLCSQTAQCDHSGAPLTPMQQPFPAERSVCVHFLCICQSALLRSQTHGKVLALFVAASQPQCLTELPLISPVNSSPKSGLFLANKALTC